jgi:hypothetical protein
VDEGDTALADDFEHAVDAVDLGRDAVALGEEEPAGFAGVGETDTARGLGGPGEETAAEEALQVVDDVVVGVVE